MINFKIQLFGGRGSKIGLGIKKMLSDFENTGVGKGTPHEIDASRYQTLEEWEKEILHRDYETLIAFDEKGKPVKAYKGNSGSVAFPPSEANKWKGYTVTHNHPDTYGGTFSFADMRNLCKYKYGEHRAVAREGTYIVKKTKESNFENLKRTVATNMYLLESKMKQISKQEQVKYLNTPIEQRVSRKSFNTMVRQKYCGILHKFYKKVCEECGFIYILKSKNKYKE